MDCDMLCGVQLYLWETTEHLVLHCPYARQDLLRKFSLQSVPCSSPMEMITSVTTCIPSNAGLQILAKLINFPAFAWDTWRERNARIFSQICKRPSKMFAAKCWIRWLWTSNCLNFWVQWSSRTCRPKSLSGGLQSMCPLTDQMGSCITHPT